MNEEKKSRLIPITKWNQYHPWPSIGGLRHLVAHAKNKKCTHILLKQAASHKKYIVEIKKSYRETVNLWALSVLSPASRKSSVYGQITTPIRLWEEQNKAALEPIINKN